MTEKYRIEAYSHDILLFGSHDFWILRAPNGDVMAELHGLATDRETGKIEPIGTDSTIHSLRGYHFANDNSFLNTLLENGISSKKGPYMVYKEGSIPTERVGVVVFEGTADKVLSRWMSAAKAIPEINQQDLDYPNYGFKIDGTTVNSNSMFHTYGDIMKLPTPDFPQVVEPGWDNRVLPQERIEAYKGDYEQIDNLKYPFHKDGASLNEKIKPFDDIPYWKEERLKDAESKFQEQIKGSRDYSIDDSNSDLKDFFKNLNADKTPKELGEISSNEKVTPSTFLDNKSILEDIPVVTGNETVDLLLANLDKSIDNITGFDLDVMIAVTETKEGKGFIADVDRGVEEMKVAESNIENDIQSPGKSKGVAIS